MTHFSKEDLKGLAKGFCRIKGYDLIRTHRVTPTSYKHRPGIEVIGVKNFKEWRIKLSPDTYNGMIMIDVLTKDGESRYQNFWEVEAFHDY
tara:strand:+ start:82 stop:354 length:273 start_codon:yes stop_codon:yes gene_type:complete